MKHRYFKGRRCFSRHADRFVAPLRALRLQLAAQVALEQKARLAARRAALADHFFARSEEAEAAR